MNSRRSNKSWFYIFSFARSLKQVNRLVTNTRLSWYNSILMFIKDASNTDRSPCKTGFYSRQSLAILSYRVWEFAKASSNVFMHCSLLTEKNTMKRSSRIHQLSGWQQQILRYKLCQYLGAILSLKAVKFTNTPLVIPPQATVTAAILSCCRCHLSAWEQNVILTSIQPGDEWATEDRIRIKRWLW